MLPFLVLYYSHFIYRVCYNLKENSGAKGLKCWRVLSSLRFYGSVVCMLCLLSPMCATCPVHLILLDLTSRIFGEEYIKVPTLNLERIRSLYTSSTTKFIFHYTKGYMFRPYNQVIIRPTSKLRLQMLCLMGSHLVHILKTWSYLYNSVKIG
jgi:hypothetical protein